MAERQFTVDDITPLGNMSSPMYLNSNLVGKQE